MKLFKKLSQISLSVVLGLIAFLYSPEAKAQFNKGDKLLSLGVGVAATYKGAPFYLTYEQQAFHRNISVGGTAGYQSWSDGYTSTLLTYSVDYSSYLFGIRGSYHLNEAFDLNVENLDLYVGIGLGHRSYSYSSTVNTQKTSFPVYSSGTQVFVHGGVRYYLHKNIALYLELGWSGLSALQSGVTFRF